jgi:hypothetical protein
LYHDLNFFLFNMSFRLFILRGLCSGLWVPRAIYKGDRTNSGADKGVRHVWISCPGLSPSDMTEEIWQDGANILCHLCGYEPVFEDAFGGILPEAIGSSEAPAASNRDSWPPPFSTAPAPKAQPSLVVKAVPLGQEYAAAPKAQPSLVVKAVPLGQEYAPAPKAPPSLVAKAVPLGQEYPPAPKAQPSLVVKAAPLGQEYRPALRLAPALRPTPPLPLAPLPPPLRLAPAPPPQPERFTCQPLGELLGPGSGSSEVPQSERVAPKSLREAPRPDALEPQLQRVSQPEPVAPKPLREVPRPDALEPEPQRVSQPEQFVPKPLGEAPRPDALEPESQPRPPIAQGQPPVPIAQGPPLVPESPSLMTLIAQGQPLVSESPSLMTRLACALETAAVWATGTLGISAPTSATLHDSGLVSLQLDSGERSSLDAEEAIELLSQYGAESLSSVQFVGEMAVGTN